MLFYDSDRRILHLINRKVTLIMSQIEDLKSAVADELADANALLGKLSSITQQQNNPDIDAVIKQLQDSHAQIQAALAPKAP